MVVTPAGVAKAPDGAASATQETVFISKGTPEDDEFVLWLAPRLEAAGYAVFPDILSLEPGDRWREQVTGTAAKRGGQDAPVLPRRHARKERRAGGNRHRREDLVKELKDPRFIIPLRLEKFKKVSGVGELQWVNFLAGRQ